MRLNWVDMGAWGEEPECWYCGAPVLGRKRDFCKHKEDCRGDELEAEAEKHRLEMQPDMNNTKED